MVALVALAPPVFCTVMVYVIAPPARTGSGASALAIRRTGCNTVTATEALLLAGSRSAVAVMTAVLVNVSEPAVMAGSTWPVTVMTPPCWYLSVPTSQK